MSASPARIIAFAKQVFGTSFIGFTIATTLYGITCLQTYLYFRNYPQDHKLLKSTVAVLWILDSLTTIFVAHSLYTSFVLNFGLPPAEVNVLIPWSFTAEKLLVTLITFVAQVFYGRTIWRMSAHRAAPILIVVFALVALALGLVTTAHLFQNPLATSISDRKFSILSGLVQGFASLDDILITVAMCVCLHARRPAAGFRNSAEKMIDNLILYAVSRGVLTAVTQILFLVLNVALPYDTYWQPFHQAVGKRLYDNPVYVNSVMATLNVRSTFKETDEGGGIAEGGIEFVAPNSLTRDITFDHEDSDTSQTNYAQVAMLLHDTASSTPSLFHSVVGQHSTKVENSVSFAP